MKILISIILISITHFAYSQNFKGKIRDKQSGRILVGVKVQSSRDSTRSNIQGEFEIKVNDIDSIFFIHKEYRKQKVEINASTVIRSIFVELIPNSVPIEEVVVSAKTKTKDTIQFKESLGIPKMPKYREVFLNRADFSPNSRGFLANGSTATLFTVDLLSISRMLFKKKKEPISQEQLLENEEYNIQYIDGKFSLELIEELTGLKGDKAKVFQNTYRPTMPEFLKMSDYDIRAYINQKFKDTISEQNIQ